MSDATVVPTETAHVAGVMARQDRDPAVRVLNALRAEVKGTAGRLAEAKLSVSRMAPLVGEERGETMANIMLAYRHLEDASMRLGKAIQARDGGASVYDRETTVGA